MKDRSSCIFAVLAALALALPACGGSNDKASDPTGEDAGTEIQADAGEENTCERTEPGDICCGTERCGVGHECGESGACEEIRPALLADVQGGVTEIHEDGSDSMTIHLSLSHNPRVGDVKVYWDISHSIWNEGDKVVCLSADGADGDAAANHGVILNAGNWQTGIDVTCRYDAEGTNAVLSPDNPIRLDFATQSDDNMAFNYLTASPGGLVLKDSDEAKVIVTLPEDLTTTEDGGSIQFRVRLASKPPSNADRLYLKITAANDDGTEAPYGLPDPEQLAFYHDYLCAEYDCWNQDQVVTVTGQDDRAFNIAAHTYTVKIGLRDEDVESCSTEEGKANLWCGLEPVVIHLLNADNDSPDILTDVTTFQVSESGTAAKVGVKLSGKPKVPVTMTADIEPAEECLLVTGENGATSATATLSFPADDTFGTYQYLTIIGLDDLVDDGDAACTLTLTAAASSGSSETDFDGKTRTVTGTNRNDDTAGILGMNPSPSTIAETAKAGFRTSGTMALSLASKPLDDVQVSMSYTNVDTADLGQHLSFSPTRLSFTPGNYNVPQTVTFSAVSDHRINPSGYSMVNLTAMPISADLKYSQGGASAQVKVLDTDKAALVVGSPSTLQLREGSSTSSSIKVSLSSIPTANVSVTATSSDPSRLKVSIGSQSIADDTASNPILTGSWSSGLTFYAYAVNDNIKNASNTAKVIFTTRSDDSNFDGKSVETANFTIEDNDTAQLVVGSPSTRQLQEGSSTSSSIKVSLSSIPTAAVRFTVTSSDATRLKVSLSNSSSTAASSVTGTISPEDWSSGTTIYAFAVNDSTSNTNNTAKLNFTTNSRDANFNGLSASTPNFFIEDDDVEIRTLTVSCTNRASCVRVDHTTATCTASLNSSNRPSLAQSVTVSCTSREVYLPNSVTLSSANNWSAVIGDSITSKCCGASVEGTDNKTGTVTCTATGTGFKATGSDTVLIRAHNAGDCEWLY